MGQSAGKLMKKGYDYMSSRGGETPTTSSTSLQNPQFKLAGTPFVLTRSSSLYFDEDGDLAHEFYRETLSKNSKSKYVLKRIRKGLKHQGEVKLEFPRINNNFPIILYEG